MSESTFKIRLINTADDARFVYYDHTEERAGDIERVVTTEWSEHAMEDLDRVMTMIEVVGYRFEVRGLTRVDDLLSPLGYHWTVNTKSRKTSSPWAVHAQIMKKLEAEAPKETDV